MKAIGKYIVAKPKKALAPDIEPINIHLSVSTLLIKFNFFKYIMINGATKNITAKKANQVKAGIKGIKPRIPPIIKEHMKIIFNKALFIIIGSFNLCYYEQDKVQ